MENDIWQHEHEVTKKVGKIIGVPGEVRTLDIPTDLGVVKAFNCRLLVQTKNEGAAATGEVWETILGVIRKLTLEVNGNDTRYQATGRQIRKLSLMETGKDIPSLKAIVPVLAPHEARTYIVDFSLRFNLPNHIEGRVYGLDLRPAASNPNVYSSVKLHFECGSAANMFVDAGGTVVTSASLEVGATIIRKYAGVDRLLTRDHRSEIKEYTATGAVEFEVPLVQGARLVSICAVCLADGQEKIFNRGGYIELSAGEYIVRNEGMWAIKSKAGDLREEAISDSICHIDLTSYNSILTAPHSDHLNEKMKLSLPAIYTAGVRNEIEVFYVFGKKVKFD